MKRLSPAIEAGLVPLAWLYSSIMHARNLSFDLGLRVPQPLGASVISVGNLTAGGTGKTPVVAWLFEEIRKKGKRVAIVSRGYGGEIKGPAKVPPDGKSETAKNFGDEPAWFAARFADAPVFIGADRVRAVREILQTTDVDVILADDAFQHRNLPRSLDIVILDATEPRWHYRSLPLGRLREGFSSLLRAQVVLITKTNLAPDKDQISWLKKKISEVFASKAVKPVVLELESKLSSFVGLNGSETLEIQKLKDKKVLSFCGIGRPESFQSLIEKEARAQVLENIAFKDHHAYSVSDLEKIEVQANALGASHIVTTEKDATKLSHWKPELPVLVAKLEIGVKTETSDGALKEFYEAIDRAIF